MGRKVAKDKLRIILKELNSKQFKEIQLQIMILRCEILDHDYKFEWAKL